jgi:excisionase family DNA binding protein
MSRSGEATVIAREYVDLKEAAKLLGKSTKTVERLHVKGELRGRLERREGRKDARTYHAGDLERIKAEHIPSSRIPPGAGLRPAKTAELAIPEKTGIILKELARFFQQPAAPAPWLSLKEAAEVSGLSESYLRGLIDTEELVAFKAGPHGAWRIRRASLEEWDGQ